MKHNMKQYFLHWIFCPYEFNAQSTLKIYAQIYLWCTKYGLGWRINIAFQFSRTHPLECVTFSDSWGWNRVWICSNIVVQIFLCKHIHAKHTHKHRNNFLLAKCFYICFSHKLFIYFWSITVLVAHLNRLRCVNLYYMIQI